MLYVRLDLGKIGVVGKVRCQAPGNVELGISAELAVCGHVGVTLEIADPAEPVGREFQIALFGGLDADDGPR